MIPEKIPESLVNLEEHMALWSKINEIIEYLASKEETPVTDKKENAIKSLNRQMVCCLSCVSITTGICTDESCECHQVTQKEEEMRVNTCIGCGMASVHHSFCKSL